MKLKFAAVFQKFPESHATFVRKLSSADKRGAPQVNFYSLKGHRVLTPVISQSDLADEMFSR